MLKIDKLQYLIISYRIADFILKIMREIFVIRIFLLAISICELLPTDSILAAYFANSLLYDYVYHNYSKNLC